jgi:Tfp pilus assembly protein PilX
MKTYRIRAQRGMVLISSLLLLVVVTIIALSMFRS